MVLPKSRRIMSYRKRTSLEDLTEAMTAVSSSFSSNSSDSSDNSSSSDSLASDLLLQEEDDYGDSSSSSSSTTDLFVSLVLPQHYTINEEECRKIKKRQRRRVVLSQQQMMRSLLHQPLLPRGPWKVRCGAHPEEQEPQIIMDAPGVQFLKFCTVAVLSILFVHYYAIWTNADRDESYGLNELILMDGPHIALDLVAFFVVGRLYQEEAPSVDTLAWALPSIVAALIQSVLATHSTSLHHSITPYEMMCTWSWQFWVLILGGVLPMIILLGGAHLAHAWRSRVFFQKVLELTFSILVFLVPYAQNSFFHLHHWYYALVLGMHANAHTVWWSSRGTMCILFGIYVNGIAIYGRDPILTCGVTLYQSQNQQCPYLSEDFQQEPSSSSWEALLLASGTPPSLDWSDCGSQ